MRSSSTPVSSRSVAACAAPSRPPPSNPTRNSSTSAHSCPRRTLAYGHMKLAAAPISWGVCEVPGWGLQLDRERVLQDAVRLGLPDIEAGPPGFLPKNPREARAAIARHGIRVIGGVRAAGRPPPPWRRAGLLSAVAPPAGPCPAPAGRARVAAADGPGALGR